MISTHLNQYQTKFFLNLPFTDEAFQDWCASQPHPTWNQKKNLLGHVLELSKEKKVADIQKIYACFRKV